MRYIYIILFTLITANNLFCQNANYKGDYLFKNAQIISMKSNIPPQKGDLLVKNGVIIGIGKFEKTQAKKSIDLKGKYIMPTLSDAHVHLSRNEEGLKKQLTLNLINGITKVRSMRGEWKDKDLVKEFKLSMVTPKIYICPPPIRWRQNFNDSTLTAYFKKSQNFDFIKILSVKDEDTFKKIDSFAKLNKINIGGHFPKYISDTALVNSNYNSFEHLGGLIGIKKESLEKRVDWMKNKNIFVCPTLQWYVIGYGQHSVDDMLKQRGMEYINDSIKKYWAKKSRQYRNKLGKIAFKEEVLKYSKELEERCKILKLLNDYNIKLLLSPDSSSKFIVSGFGLLEEMELYKKAGFSNYEILKTTTINFADFFNENYGTIELNKDADFLILNKNPLNNLDALKSIQGIFYDNKFLTKKDLKKLSKSILP